MGTRESLGCAFVGRLTRRDGGLTAPKGTHKRPFGTFVGSPPQPTRMDSPHPVGPPRSHPRPPPPGSGSSPTRPS